jgi:Tat protein secretion system quality control protein TatD with DNase activity
LRDERGPINEPAHLVCVLRAAAEIRGVSEAEIAARTWENACRVFPPKDAAPSLTVTGRGSS